MNTLKLLFFFLLSFFTYLTIGEASPREESFIFYQLSCADISTQKCESQACLACQQDKQCVEEIRDRFSQKPNDCHAKMALLELELQRELMACSDSNEAHCHKTYLTQKNELINEGLNQVLPGLIPSDPQLRRQLRQAFFSCAQDDESNSIYKTFQCFKRALDRPGLERAKSYFENELIIALAQADRARMLGLEKLSCSNRPDSKDCRCLMEIPSECQPGLNIEGFLQALDPSQVQDLIGEAREAAFVGLCLPQEQNAPDSDALSSALARIGINRISECGAKDCPRSHTLEDIKDFIQTTCTDNEQTLPYCLELSGVLTQQYCSLYCDDAQKGLYFVQGARPIRKFEACDRYLRPDFMDQNELIRRCSQNSMPKEDAQKICSSLALEYDTQLLPSNLLELITNVSPMAFIELLRKETLKNQAQRHKQYFGENIDSMQIKACQNYLPLIEDAQEQVPQETFDEKEKAKRQLDKINDLINAVREMKASADNILRKEACFGEGSFFSRCRSRHILSLKDSPKLFQEEKSRYEWSKRNLARPFTLYPELSVGMDNFHQAQAHDWQRPMLHAYGYQLIFRELPDYEVLRLETTGAPLEEVRKTLAHKQALRKKHEFKGCSAPGENGDFEGICQKLTQLVTKDLSPRAKENFLSSMEKTCLAHDEGGISAEELIQLGPQAQNVLKAMYPQVPSDALLSCDDASDDEVGFKNLYCCMKKASATNTKIMNDFYQNVDTTCGAATLMALPLAAVLGPFCAGVSTATTGLRLIQENRRSSQELEALSSGVGSLESIFANSRSNPQELHQALTLELFGYGAEVASVLNTVQRVRFARKTYEQGLSAKNQKTIDHLNKLEKAMIEQKKANTSKNAQKVELARSELRRQIEMEMGPNEKFYTTYLQSLTPSMRRLHQRNPQLLNKLRTMLECR